MNLNVIRGERDCRESGERERDRGERERETWDRRVCACVREREREIKGREIGGRERKEIWDMREWKYEGENVFEWKVKGYFGILDNLSLGQKVVPWFSEGHEQF